MRARRAQAGAKAGARTGLTGFVAAEKPNLNQGCCRTTSASSGTTAGTTTGTTTVSHPSTTAATGPAIKLVVAWDGKEARRRGLVPSNGCFNC